MTSGKYVIFLEDSTGKASFLRENLGFTEKLVYAKKFDTLELAISANEMFLQTRVNRASDLYMMILQIPERRLKEEYSIEMGLMAKIAMDTNGIDILGPFVNTLGAFAGIMYLVIAGNTRVELDISNGYVAMMGKINGVQLRSSGNISGVMIPLNEATLKEALRQIKIA